MTQDQIASLRKIKKAILVSDAVICVIWMDPTTNGSNETVCERIDSLLIEAGVSPEELEADYTKEYKR